LVALTGPVPWFVAGFLIFKALLFLWPILVPAMGTPLCVWVAWRYHKQYGGNANPDPTWK
jgi:hypothetical protein